MLGRTSLGSIGLVVGGVLAVMGFVAYFMGNSTLNLIGFFYGIPILLGGLALKAAELKPVPFTVPTPPDVLTLREQHATDTQNQIRKDVTRFRYGQQIHLDTSLESLALGQTDDEHPILQGLREEDTDGAYTLVLEFASEAVEFDVWEKKRERIERFFGPGIRVALSQPEPEIVTVALIADASMV
ncbi:MAG: DUF2854 domain-containing protein [Kaiparowitsia implicata GSE-PSE-MK54-09C]|nr:DUF2854 domain-containing protein [Kaiparowitsia implicata GSE-PSE-MK54-09C]